MCGRDLHLLSWGDAYNYMGVPREEKILSLSRVEVITVSVRPELGYRVAIGKDRDMPYSFI